MLLLYIAMDILKKTLQCSCLNTQLYPQQNDKVQHQTVFQDEEHLLSKKGAENVSKNRKGKRLFFCGLSQ